jgi:UDP-glucose 4-epimerase
VRALVTRGAGFIGSHLVYRLVRDGDPAIVIDNESNRSCRTVPANDDFLDRDVTRLGTLERAFSRPIDVVLHLAGHVPLIRSFTDPLLDMRTNIEGTVNVIQMCVKHRSAV